MEASLAAVDNLERQIFSGTLSVSSACRKIEVMINEAGGDAAGRYYYQLVPRLLKLILGQQQKPGLLEYCEDHNSANEVYRLLSPKGYLFSSILAHYIVDPGVKLEVSIKDFGLPDGSTSFQGGRIVNGFAQFDICEYFYLQLITVATSALQIQPNSLSTDKRVESSVKGYYRKFLSVSLGLPDILTESSCRWRHDLVADTFLTIISAHFEYLMPIKADSKDHGYVNPLFRSKSSIVMRLAEFLFGTMVDLWISASLTSKSFRLPTIDLIHCIEAMAKHLCSAVCSQQPINKNVAQSADTCYALMRVELYKFLKVNISNWPVDQGFAAIVGLWKVFVAPWIYVSTPSSVSEGKLVEFWTPYVLNNYLFYVALFPLILEHCEGVLGFLYESIDNECLEKGELQRLLGRCTETLHQSTETIVGISALLRNVEQTEAPSGQLLGRRSNLYPELRLSDQLSALEPESPRFVPTLFDAVSKGHAMNLVRLLERLFERVQEKVLVSVETTGKMAAAQDEILRIFQISPETYALYQADIEAIEARDRREESRRSSFISSPGTPRHRRLLPSTPKSRIAHLKELTPKTTVNNDEVPILAIFFRWLSKQINSGVNVALDQLSRRYQVPQWSYKLAKVDLSFLAVWQNLLFTCIAILFIIFITIAII